MMKASAFQPRLTPVLIAAAFLAPSSRAADWQEVPLPDGAVYARATAAGPEHVFAALHGEDDAPLGLYRTALTDPGDWEPLGFAGARIRDILVQSPGQTQIWISTDDEALVYRSTNSGEQWIAAGAGLPGSVASTLAWNGGSPGRFYCVTRTDSEMWISSSTNNGASWTITTTTWPQNSDILLAAAHNPDRSDDVVRAQYNLYWDAEVWRSTNAGTEWSPVLYEWGWPPVALRISPVTDRTYVQIMRSNTSWVARADDDGTLPNWIVPGAGFGLDSPPWANGHLLAAWVTPEGRLRVGWRHEEGAEWSDLSVGLTEAPSPSPTSMPWKFSLRAAIDAPYAVMSTATLGVWIRDLRDVTTVDHEPAAALRFLAPSPNPMTSEIRFRVLGGVDAVDGGTGGALGGLRVRILDPGGRVVRTIHSASGSAVWNGRFDDGRTVPAGVYYYHTLSGRQEARGKVVVVR